MSESTPQFRGDPYPYMGKDRYDRIEGLIEELTVLDQENGWHQCDAWDLMLIHRSWPEYTHCLCRP